MKLQVEQIKKVTVVRLPGDVLDANNVQVFKQEIAPLLDRRCRAVFHMGALRFVDSSGCGALLHCSRQLRSAGGDLKLCNLSKEITDLFKLLRLNQILEIHDTLDAALEAFKD